MADDFRDAGADLILTGTSQDVIGQLNDDLGAKGIKNVRYLAVDFSKDESINNFFEIDDKYDTFFITKLRKFIAYGFVCMIAFDLKCDEGHIFEGWFDNNEAYEDQKKRGLISRSSRAWGPSNESGT